jgi:hypothetical protein
VVADLLERGQQRQDPPPPLDALAEAVVGERVLDRRLVEGGLLGREAARDDRLQLVGQVRGDVALQPAEEEGRHQPAQAGGRVGVAPPLDRDGVALYERVESPEQPGGCTNP